MTRSSKTLWLTDSNAGPTLGELKTFVDALIEDGTDSQTMVKVDRSPYYNQFDRGEWRLEVIQ